MGLCWGDIEEGVRIEVPNSDTSLSTKVYWIAEIIKLAGRITTKNKKITLPEGQHSNSFIQTFKKHFPELMSQL